MVDKCLTLNSALDQERYFGREELALFIGGESVFRETVVEQVSDYLNVTSSTHRERERALRFT
jgi:hypothetical protein